MTYEEYEAIATAEADFHEVEAADEREARKADIARRDAEDAARRSAQHKEDIDYWRRVLTEYQAEHKSPEYDDNRVQENFQKVIYRRAVAYLKNALLPRQFKANDGTVIGDAGYSHFDMSEHEIEGLAWEVVERILPRALTIKPVAFMKYLYDVLRSVEAKGSKSAIKTRNTRAEVMVTFDGDGAGEEETVESAEVHAVLNNRGLEAWEAFIDDDDYSVWEPYTPEELEEETEQYRQLLSERMNLSPEFTDRLAKVYAGISDSQYELLQKLNVGVEFTGNAVNDGRVLDLIEKNRKLVTLLTENKGVIKDRKALAAEMGMTDEALKQFIKRGHERLGVTKKKVKG